MNGIETPQPASPRLRSRPWRHGVAVWIATGFWLGFVPWAPGTIGSLWGIPLAFVLANFAPWVQVLVIAVLTLAGIPICTAAARRLGLKDPGCIVFDEIVSLGITFFLVPITNPLVVIVGFGLHRLFDITKPPPLRRLERLPDGMGIMADDVMAGVYSNLVLRAMLWAGALGSTGG